MKRSASKYQVNREDPQKFNINIDKYYSKKYEFKANEGFTLPNVAFVANKWSIQKLHEKKQLLNDVKGQLNSFSLSEWSKHTKFRDPSSFIMKYLTTTYAPELLTQAWCKFYECLNQYDVIPAIAVRNGYLASIHLCEAPGAFISSLNTYLYTNHPELQWQWMANTLNPDYEGNSLSEMIPDDRLIRYTMDKWIFGSDATGDIRNYSCHLEILEASRKLNEVWLVTADGSIDCMSNPGEQEVSVAHLHYCEAMSAIAVLHAGGTFVIKIFTMFEDSTVCLLYLLHQLFEKLCLFKPSSSKSGNSEVYVICLNYKAKEILNSNLWESLMEPYQMGSLAEKFSMFDINEISQDFLEEIVLCTDYFMEKQISTINENIKWFKKRSSFENAKISSIKSSVSTHYISKYKINSVPPNKRIMHLADNYNLVSFYQQQWNRVSKWCFEENLKTLLVPNLQWKTTSDLLRIRIGKKVSTVLHSNFCSKENIIDIRKYYSCTVYEDLYHNALKFIGQKNDCALISLADFAETCDHCEFQRIFFFKLKGQLGRKNIVILKIPLLTNFLVHLIFLYMSMYEKIVFHKSGFIVFNTIDEDAVQEIRKCFDVIQSVYNNIDTEERYCDSDILQLIPFKLICDSPLYISYLWNYNNVVLT